jgi:hypothetical protein
MADRVDSMDEAKRGCEAGWDVVAYTYVALKNVFEEWISDYEDDSGGCVWAGE